MDFFLHGAVRIKFDDTAYLTDYKNISVFSVLLERTNKVSITGNGVNLKIHNSINASLGEFIERLVMYDNYKQLFLRDIILTGTSLRTGKQIMLNQKEIKAKSLFFDSCGLSSHVTSKACITNSINEFIERQSFIFNYLSKSKGELIEKRLYNSFCTLPLEFNGIRFYNISLVPEYYVILAILRKPDEVWVGLGSDSNFKSALLTSVKEIQQFYLSRKFQKKKKRSYNKGDYAYLYDTLSADEIEASYDYLRNSPKMNDINQYKENLPFNKILKNLYDKCKIDPYLFFLQTNTSNWFKVCQIIDLNWFPCLDPKQFSKNVYNFVSTQMNVELDQRSNFIPFP